MTRGLPVCTFYRTAEPWRLQNTMPVTVGKKQNRNKKQSKIIFWMYNKTKYKVPLQDNLRVLQRAVWQHLIFNWHHYFRLWMNDNRKSYKWFPPSAVTLRAWWPRGCGDPDEALGGVRPRAVGQRGFVVLLTELFDPIAGCGHLHLGNGQNYAKKVWKLETLQWKQNSLD